VKEIGWWPSGHPLRLSATKHWKDTMMTYEQALELAELEADIAFERYLTAFDPNEHPAFLDDLSTEAHLAQPRVTGLPERGPAH